MIELIVVIAIVAILAAIAVPAYKRYMITSRMAAASILVQRLAQRSIEFAATKGRFGNAYDLGLTTTAGSFFASDSIVSNTMGAYFLPAASGGGLSVLDWGSWGGGTPCGSQGAVYAVFDAQKLGFATSVAVNNNGHAFGDGVTGGVILACDFWYSKVVYTACWYSYGTSSVSGTDSLLPGWFNWNLTSGYDGQGYLNPVYSTQSSRTCQ